MAQSNIKNLPAGEYVTEHGYSQSYPWKIVGRTKMTLKIVPVKTIRDPEWKPEMHPGGFAAHCSNQHEQTWLYAGLEDEYRPRTLRWSKKHGRWMFKGTKYSEGYARYFYDYNF